MAAALKMGGAILAASLDAAAAGPPIIAQAAPVSPNARPIIMRAIDWRLHEPRFGIPRKEGMALFGHELTRQLAIENAGELQTFLDGGRRLITADSIAIRMIALALLSHPVDGPTLKVRLPPGRYQKRPRPRTPQELEGLRAGNERRAEEARRRREAKTAARV
jgi:hypothetical protein